jgi:hypothetical protein
MDDTFSGLLGLTHAAESCWGQSLSFVERFSHVPEFSSDPGAARSQAKLEVDCVQHEASEVLTAIEAWREANRGPALSIVSRAVGIKLEPYFINGVSVQTAHEAAVWYAEAVHHCYRCPDGVGTTWKYEDYFQQLADDLAKLPKIADPWARLQGEHYAASDLTTCGGEPEAESASIPATTLPVSEEIPEYLFGWPEILGCVKRPDSQSERERLRTLNSDHDGPIVFMGQGVHPRCDKKDLAVWWRRLFDMFRESQERQAELHSRKRDEAETVKESHSYGRDGTAFSGIGGGEKRRRQKKSSENIPKLRKTS